MFETLIAAYLRGRPEVGELPEALRGSSWETVARDRCEAMVSWARERGIRLHRFKRTMGLERVRRALGLLRGLVPESLLDLGSGRGAFLWPLLEERPDLPVLVVDRERIHLEYVASVARGGRAGLAALQGDGTCLPLPDDAVDGVTLLEVLEHIPDAQAALAEAVRVARRFVLLSVPSRPDDNPEHIHLFSREDLASMLREAGAGAPRFTGVHGHHLALSMVGGRG